MIVATSDRSKNGMSTTEYDLVPMNSAMAAYLEDLGRAMEHGSVIPDANRQDFFEVVSGNHWFYVHVQPQTDTAYLVAHRRAAAS